MKGVTFSTELRNLSFDHGARRHKKISSKTRSRYALESLFNDLINNSLLNTKLVVSRGVTKSH